MTDVNFGWAGVWPGTIGGRAICKLLFFGVILISSYVKVVYVVDNDLVISSLKVDRFKVF